MSDSLVRYQVEKKPTDPKSEIELRHEIVQVGRMMWQRGFVASNDGNISARLDEERFLCTPSGISKGLLEPEQLLVINWDVEPVGKRTTANKTLRPSSEMLLHIESYKQRSDVLAVVHAHPPTAIAVSVAGVRLDHCMLPDVVLALGSIPTCDYATPASIEGARVISELIRRYDALVLQRHGSVTVGASPLDAYMKLEKVEQVAQITKAIHELGGADALPGEEMEKLLAWRRSQGIMHPDQEREIRTAAGLS